MRFSDDGDFVGYQGLEPEALESMGFVTIATYPTFLAGEVQEEALGLFLTLAEENMVSYEVRRDFDLIQVNGYSFSSFGEDPDFPDDLALESYEGEVGVYLIQFKAPVTAEWLEELRSVSSVLSYIPENTFIVRASPTVSQHCREMVGVQHVSLFQPAYKIQRALLTIGEQVDVTMQLDGDQDLAGVGDFLEGLTSGQVEIRGESDSRRVRVDMTRSNLVEAAARPEVLWIEPTMSPVWSGERQSMVTAGLHNGARPDDPESGGSHDGYHEWLLDKGFCTPTEAPAGCYPYWTKVGLFDSGLNTMVCPEASYNPVTGVCANWDAGDVGHPDLEHNSNLQTACSGQSAECYAPVLRRFYCAEDWGGDSQCLLGSDYVFSDTAPILGGHGTSVGSIVASIPSTNPVQQDSADYFRGTGLAPSAQIILAKFTGYYEGDQQWDDGMSEVQYKDLMDLVQNTGARFASNSWNLKDDWYNPDPQGSPSFLPETSYSGFSQMMDRLVRDSHGPLDSFNHPMTVIFSTGNFGVGWVRSPANAKNIIAVGASHGWSTTGADGAAHPGCQSLNSTIDDIAGGGTWQSNRMYIGEDDSGDDLPRFKPDLVAPGTQIVAAREQEPVFSDFYRCFLGTSAATPAVTGAAILADAWYYHVISNPQATPSPAMVKAMLIAHADDLYGGTDHFTNTTLPHSPSPAQGWGRVNLDALFQEDIDVTVYDEDHAINPTRRFTVPGSSWSKQMQVDDSTKPIIAVMVFTDAPSEPTATGGLMVNNLNLRITKPGTIRTQKSYTGNFFATNSWYSQQLGYLIPYFAIDRNNTVEVIRIPPQALTGPFVLTVTGQLINTNAVPGLDNNNPNQDFALYVYNATLTP